MSSISAVIKRNLSKLELKRGAGDKSSFRQILEILMMIFRIQLEPDEYYKFGFYKKGIPLSNILNYLISTQYSREISPILNPPSWSFLMNDKMVFNLYCLKHDIPVTRQFGFYSKIYGQSTGTENFGTHNGFLDFLAREKPRGLVFKPHDAYGGYKILVFNEIEYGEEILFRSPNGMCMNQNELLEQLDMMLAKGKKIKGFVVEGFVRQHPVLQELYPHSVNTIRLLTYLTRDNTPKIIGAYLRLGQKGKQVDNVSQGGIGADIELSSGTLLGGMSYGNYELPGMEIHPDTGIRYTGIKIPRWTDILEISRKAALAMPFQRYIGWDIAVTDGGPVIIEGNSSGVDSIWHQIRFGGILTDEFKNDMMEYGIGFPDRIPLVNFSNIYKSYKISRRSRRLV